MLTQNLFALQARCQNNSLLILQINVVYQDEFKSKVSFPFSLLRPAADIGLLLIKTPAQIRLRDTLSHLPSARTTLYS